MAAPDITATCRSACSSLKAELEISSDDCGISYRYFAITWVTSEFREDLGERRSRTFRLFKDTASSRETGWINTNKLVFCHDLLPFVVVATMHIASAPGSLFATQQTSLVRRAFCYAEKVLLDALIMT
jgi:hypothetical protein